MAVLDHVNISKHLGDAGRHLLLAGTFIAGCILVAVAINRVKALRRIED